MSGSGNGFTGAVNVFGIVAIYMYLICLYRKIPYVHKSEKLLFVIGVVLLINGEFFLNYPMFWGLLFINISKEKSLKTK